MVQLILYRANFLAAAICKYLNMARIVGVDLELVNSMAV
jgi:hypothetical protein